MRLCLYDAAFAALVQVTPSRGRRAISYLTLFGAFASSVFWVLGHFFNEAFGWRQTLALFAAINLFVCLPLNWFGLARREAPHPVEAAQGPGPAARDGAPLEGRLRAVAIGIFTDICSAINRSHGTRLVFLLWPRRPVPLLFSQHPDRHIQTVCASCNFISGYPLP